MTPNQDQISIFKTTLSFFKDSASQASSRQHAKGWSIQEILGHLIDSAMNNHQRFLRIQDHQTVLFPSYPQDEFVQRSYYHQYEFDRLLHLFESLNDLIIFVLNRYTSEDFKNLIQVGDFEPVTLQFLVDDYYHHMNHHLLQAQKILKA